jgi:hypothetical protein
MPIRKILVPLSGQYDLADPESLERPALETAFVLGRRLDAHVEVYCIEADLTHTQFRLSPWIPGSSVDVLIDMIAKESIERRDRARALFQSAAERFSAAHIRRPDPKVGFSVNFLEEMGEDRRGAFRSRQAGRPDRHSLLSAGGGTGASLRY